jgi:signal transduction histidine kinase
MKVPITGIQLLCENNKSSVTRKILTQTEMISQSVERVLFYARLGSVEKDYLITEVPLKACVLEVLAQDKQFLIQNNVCIHTETLCGTVYSDQKWLQFILNQIIINSVKYQGARPLVIDVTSQDQGDYVTLSVTDNGIGIKESELSRVFDKGFVGSNGRTGKNSTGIGLYLCDQLCTRLGISIEIKSTAGEYTTVLLHFPKSEFLNA